MSREKDDAGKPTFKSCQDLEDVIVRGPNGFINIVISLAWWRRAITSNDDISLWDDALADALWVLTNGGP